jgi:hypothetical protein
MRKITNVTNVSMPTTGKILGESRSSITILKNNVGTGDHRNEFNIIEMGVRMKIDAIIHMDGKN